jgi:hypothetical protein
VAGENVAGGSEIGGILSTGIGTGTGTETEITVERGSG